MNEITVSVPVSYLVDAGFKPEEIATRLYQLAYQRDETQRLAEMVATHKNTLRAWNNELEDAWDHSDTEMHKAQRIRALIAQTKGV